MNSLARRQDIPTTIPIGANLSVHCDHGLSRRTRGLTISPAAHWIGKTKGPFDFFARYLLRYLFVLFRRPPATRPLRRDFQRPSSPTVMSQTFTPLDSLFASQTPAQLLRALTMAILLHSRRWQITQKLKSFCIKMRNFLFGEDLSSLPSSPCAVDITSPTFSIRSPLSNARGRPPLHPLRDRVT
jgi:hypothetical protein